MVFFILSKYVTKTIGAPLFRSGLRLRNKLTTKKKDVCAPVGYVDTNFWLDMVCLLPYSQKILSLAIYDESKRRLEQFQKQRLEQQQQKYGTNKTSLTLPEDCTSMITDPVSTRYLSKMRVSVLEEYLRSSLIPADRWDDIEHTWRYNLRVVAWIRKEFLICKYGPIINEALTAYPELRYSPQLLGSNSTGDRRRRIFLDLIRRGELTLNDRNNNNNSKNPSSPFMQLPKSSIILDAFRMKQWNTKKDTQRIVQNTVIVAKNIGGRADVGIDSNEETHSTRNHIHVPLEKDLSSTNFEDILDVVTRGYVKNCGPLNALCVEANFYQLLSQEYVKHLGDYLLHRTASRRSAVATQQQEQTLDDNGGCIPLISQDTVILDIGAGDGVLMHCLRDYMEREVKGVHSKNSTKISCVMPKMVAIDDMSWRMQIKGPVEKFSVEEALKKYAAPFVHTATNDVDSSEIDPNNRRPQVIIICSWMPMGQDWTALFRNAEVDEYILIGEADDGTCGDNWLTWGNQSFKDKETGDERNDDNTTNASVTPPYIVDRYKRRDMDTLTKFQFSSFDLKVSKSGKTVSFRKR